MSPSATSSSVSRGKRVSPMLSMSATDSLLPLKLEVAERLVAQFGEHFVIQKQAAKGCHYVVDLQVAKRPARVVHEFLIEPPQGGAEAPVSR